MRVSRAVIQGHRTVSSQITSSRASEVWAQSQHFDDVQYGNTVMVAKDFVRR